MCKTTNSDLECLLEKADDIIDHTILRVNDELFNMYFDIGKMIVADYLQDKEQFMLEFDLEGGLGYETLKFFHEEIIS